MKLISVRWLTALLMALAANFAAAQNSCVEDFGCTLPIVTSTTNIEGGKRTTTGWYAGLVWQLGGQQGMTPNLVLGVRELSVDKTQLVSGGDVHLRVSFRNSQLSLDSVRFAYANGRTNLIGNLGVGYSFRHASPLVTAAAQVDYGRLSADYLMRTADFQFFGELTTIKNPAKVNSITNKIYGCPSGYQHLTPQEMKDNKGIVEIPVPGVIINGKTCTNLG